MSRLEILHFNDVYRVTPQKVSGGTMDVTQFAALVDSLRTEEQKQKGLFLFSGDVFSPSVESTVTRGSHMVSRGFCYPISLTLNLELGPCYK